MLYPSANSAGRGRLIVNSVLNVVSTIGAGRTYFAKLSWKKYFGERSDGKFRAPEEEPLVDACEALITPCGAMVLMKLLAPPTFLKEDSWSIDARSGEPEKKEASDPDRSPSSVCVACPIIPDTEAPACARALLNVLVT